MVQRKDNGYVGSAKGYGSDVKITVLKRLRTSEIFGDNPPLTPFQEDVCPHFTEGQEFIAKFYRHSLDPGSIPDGFCIEAWNSICHHVTFLAMGTDTPWVKEKGVVITCCDDGLRPVLFKLERVGPKIPLSKVIR